MTRDEHRNACIEAMKTTWKMLFSDPSVSVDRCWEATFDALNGIAFVLPLEATEQMIEAGENVHPEAYCAEVIFSAMSNIGDLTNAK